MSYFFIHEIQTFDIVCVFIDVHDLRQNFIDKDSDSLLVIFEIGFDFHTTIVKQDFIPITTSLVTTIGCHEVIYEWAYFRGIEF